MVVSPYEYVNEVAAAQRFALVGVAPARASEHADYIRGWLADGKHGAMGYLAEQIETRIDPARVVAGARSVICLADRYAGGADGGRADVPMGRIARYAWGDDYHRVMKKRLIAVCDAMRERWPDEVFRAAVDTAPILEREHAGRAGLGWVGKNTMLIHPTVGSWLLLGEIVTTLEVEADDAAPMADHCGTCTRCIDACPTDCLAPYEMDAARCISYLTIEHREVIAPGLHEAMGDWVAGCDVCQEVCPFNKADRGSAVEAGDEAIHPAYRPRPPAPGVSLFEVLGWDADARREAFTKSALKRIKLDMLKRNALIAAGNALSEKTDAALEGRVRKLAVSEDEPELVRETARQVLERLG